MTYSNGQTDALSAEEMRLQVTWLPFIHLPEWNFMGVLLKKLVIVNMASPIQYAQNIDTLQ